jgi:hypothetical protein
MPFARFGRAVPIKPIRHRIRPILARQRASIRTARLVDVSSVMR